MSSELLDALTILEKEKGISRDILIDAIEAALVSATAAISTRLRMSESI